MKKPAISADHLKWSLIALFVLWLFYVSGVFYVTQKPFSPADLPTLFQTEQPPFAFSLAALGRTLLDLLAALWLWALSLGVGGWVYQWLRLEKTSFEVEDNLEKITLSLGLGCGALGLLVLFLGLLGLITGPILYAVTLILTFAAAPQIVKIAIRPLAHQRPRPLARTSPLLRLYLFLALGMALTIALLPPTDWDGLFYHLTGPKIHLAAGRIAPGIDIPHLNFPSLMEMLFMLGMAVRGDVTAKLLHFGFSLLLAALVYLTAKRHLGLKNGWPAVLFLFSMPMVLTLSGWAYNDLALAFYQMAALYALLNWSIPPNPSTPDQDTGDQRSAVNGRRWLALSGVFCGLTMSLKYTAVVAPVALAGLLLWRLRRSKTPLKGALTSVLAFALPALIVSGPWYLKNWFFTGNPVYPFVFEGLFWDEFRSAAYAGSGSGIGFDPALLLGLPYQLTLGLRDANYIDGRTGPLFLAFLPLLLLYGLLRYRRKAMPPALNGLLIFALAQFAFWTVGVIWSTGLWQSRLLLPGLIPLCPALAWMIRDIRHLNHPQFSLQRFLMLFIGVVLMLGLVDQLFNNQIKSRSGWLYYRPLAHLIGTESRSAYLTRRLGVHYAAMEQLNEELPPTAVVTFLWEPRSYYCRLDCRPDSILDKYGHLQYLHGQDAAAIAQAWREEGVTHVLIFKLGLDFLLNEEGLSAEIRPDPTVLNQLKATDFDLVLDAHNAYQVYRLK